MQVCRIFSYCLSGLLIAALSSCAGNSKKDAALALELEEGFQNADRTINISTAVLLNSLNEKAQDPITKERAEIWLPKAQQVASLSKDMHMFISDLYTANTLNIDKSEELYTRLKRYKENVLSVDSSIRVTFSDNLYVVSKRFDSTKYHESDFYQLYFNNTSLDLSKAFLRKLQNNIKQIESAVISFCNAKVPHRDDIIMRFDVYEILLNQNSKYLKPGDKLKITAGIGVYSKMSAPIFIINGKMVELGENGYVIYELKAPKKPGHYQIPVNYSYTNKNSGQQETGTRTISYDVVGEITNNDQHSMDKSGIDN